MSKQKCAVFWFRRDLRLEDNVGLQLALESSLPVLPIFIFDTNILNQLESDDARITFIHQQLRVINQQLIKHNSSILIEYGKPLEVFMNLEERYKINAVYSNKDYEPYAINRDTEISEYFQSKNIDFHQTKDHVIFEESEIVKADGLPYTVYTPYKNKWLAKFESINLEVAQMPEKPLFYKQVSNFPELQEIGFEESIIKVPTPILNNLSNYGSTRDFPSKDSTSYLGPHLRFGTIGIRQLILSIPEADEVFLSELIWREFFIQILFHFPTVVNSNFKPKYNGIEWRNDEQEFKKWCSGQTGYPMVDAGLRQLNQTGTMHNRVRMIAAGFLCKHLLIDWKWGEAYFASKLLDYELASNNGNWQWSAGTGCDAAPYFRIFNPIEQLKKFDPQMNYVKKWIPELLDGSYISPIVDHKKARERALKIYKEGIEQLSK